jgi:hypothetical protein
VDARVIADSPQSNGSVGGQDSQPLSGENVTHRDLSFMVISVREYASARSYYQRYVTFSSALLVRSVPGRDPPSLIELRDYERFTSDCSRPRIESSSQASIHPELFHHHLS